MPVSPTAPADTRDTFKVKELAARWRVKQQTVISHIASGRLDAFDCSQNPGHGRPRWRIHKDAVAAYERRNSATAKRDERLAQRRRRRDRRRKRATERAEIT